MSMPDAKWQWHWSLPSNPDFILGSDDVILMLASDWSLPPKLPSTHANFHCSTGSTHKVLELQSFSTLFYRHHSRQIITLFYIFQTQSDINWLNAVKCKTSLRVTRGKMLPFHLEGEHQFVALHIILHIHINTVIVYRFEFVNILNRFAWFRCSEKAWFVGKM